MMLLLFHYSLRSHTSQQFHLHPLSPSFWQFTTAITQWNPVIYSTPFLSYIAKMIATEEEMKAARIPPAWRDVCAHVLIKLNECRRENYYRMDKCQELRHEYEKCQYEE